MTINNPALYMANTWDWAILDGCFGQTKIRPTDVDGLIERHGKCLFIETKAPGVSIPYGQTLLHKTLVRAGFSVVLVWGETGKPSKIKLLTPHTTRIYEEADLEMLRELVSLWFAWADKQPRCWARPERNTDTASINDFNHKEHTHAHRNRNDYSRRS